MLLRRDAKAELIGRVPLFSGCSKRELARVASIADEVDLPADKVLMREGERGREFYVLLEGGVAVSKPGRRINALQPGDFFGEIALLSSSPRTATVTTASPSRALVITARDFKALVRRSPGIGLKTLEALADRFEEG